MRIRIRNTGRTSAMVIEPVAKAQAELWSKIRSTDDTLGIEIRDLMSNNSSTQYNSTKTYCGAQMILSV